MDYTTVFAIREVTPTDEFPYLLFPLVGGAILILALAALAYRKRRNEPWRNLRKLMVPIFLGAGFLATTPVMLYSKSIDDELFEQFQLGNFETVEGVVRVLREQPQSGHAPGDLIEIDGQQFEIDHFSGTNAYKATLANGGHLRNGVGARIGHVGDQIVLVEIRESDLN